MLEARRPRTALGFAPHVAGDKPERDLLTTVVGIPISPPVIISPTGVQAVHPDGEVAVARASANRGTIMGLSSFASKPGEEVGAANPNLLFQMYWTGTREVMVQRMERAKAAGAKGLIVTLDWSFSNGRDWGSPTIPEKMNLKTMVTFAPNVLPHPRWLWKFVKRPDTSRTSPPRTPSFFLKPRRSLPATTTARDRHPRRPQLEQRATTALAQLEHPDTA